MGTVNARDFYNALIPSLIIGLVTYLALVGLWRIKARQAKRLMKPTAMKFDVLLQIREARFRRASRHLRSLLIDVDNIHRNAPGRKQ